MHPELIMSAFGRSTRRSLKTDKIDHNVIRAVRRGTVIRRRPTDDANGYLGGLLVSAHAIQVPDLPWPSARAGWHKRNILTGNVFSREI